MSDGPPQSLSPPARLSVWLSDSRQPPCVSLDGSWRVGPRFAVRPGKLEAAPDRRHRLNGGVVRRAYFSCSATRAMPALAQTSSFSPPGAPETPTAPIVTLPILIGTPPPTATVPGIWRR